MSIDFTRVAGEFTVNTLTVGEQTAPQVACFADGSFVIVWVSTDPAQDGSSNAIKAQLFDTSGNKVGGEFLVNDLGAGAQFTPGVCALANGTFAVTWVSNDTAQDGSGSAIKARLFDASGSPIGTEFLVNTQTSGSQMTSTITALAGGGFVVTWDDWTNFDRKAQIFDASGNKLGSEILVNTSTAYNQEYGNVVSLAGGGFVVTWRTTDPAVDSSGQASMAQIFDASGNKIGGEIRVNTLGLSDQYGATVAALPGGGFVATWETFDTAQDGSQTAVKAQIFDQLGTKIGSEFLVNQAAANMQRAPSVTALADGTFLVSWLTLDPTQDGSLGAVKARIFNADGTPAGNEFLLNTTTTGYQNFPDGVMLPDGRVVMTWTSESVDGSGQAVRAQILSLQYDPIISSNGGQANADVTVSEGSMTVATVSATDSNQGQALSYAIVGGADAALFTIDSVTGELSFVSPPDYESPADSNSDNVYQIVVSASDGARSDTQALSVTVGNVNEAPVISGTTSFSGDEGSPLLISGLSAHDPDGSSITFSLSGDDAALFTINSLTGDVQLIADLDHEAPIDANGDNVYDMVVTASDGSLSNSLAISVTVNNVNEGSTFVSPGNFAISEGSAIAGQVQALDTDGDAVAYSITGGADAALFNIDATTGVLSFIAAPDFEAPGDADHDGVYQVQVTASDGSIPTSAAISVTIGNVNEAPVITSNGGGASASLAVAENGTAVATFAATDPEGTARTWSIVGGADAARFMIDAATGALAFISAPNYEAPGDVDADNVYDVTVQASDGSLADTQAVAVIVSNVNEAPVITSGGGGASAAYIVNENILAVTTLTATDPDGSPRTWSIVGGADAARFAINASTGALSFVSAPNYEAPGDVDANNIYDVVIQASDGSLSDTQALAITVANVVDGAHITGTGSANRLTGTSAEDTINGLGGSDTITGGLGCDLLTGGTGNDTFVFSTVFDSLNSNPDMILDFGTGNDKINLSGIDANANAAGDQAFAWIGTRNFSGVAGQLRYYQSGGDTFVSGDVNGDGVGDFTIGIDPLVTLSASQFIL